MLRILRLARPQFLIASFVIYTLGALWAVLIGCEFSLARWLFGYLAIVPAHLSISYSNDYHDVDADAFGNPTMFSGGSGILVKYPQLAPTSKRIAHILIVISLVFAGLLSLWFSFSVWFPIIIALMNVMGWFYSAPPLKLSYRGWGELTTTIVAGLLFLTGYIALNGEMNRVGGILFPAVFLNGLAFILLVEIPDLKADALGNKKTWVVRLGRDRSFGIVAVCFLFSTLYLLWLSWYLTQTLNINLSLVVVLSLLPLSVALVSVFIRPIHEKSVIRFVNGIVLSLAAFLLITNMYLVFVIIH